jgi:hypothetical protein
MINVSITNKYCSSSNVYHHLSMPIPPSAIEIKFKLDTEKASKALVAIAATHGLHKVSKASDCPQLAAANALSLIVIITILYGPRPALKCSTASS